MKREEITQKILTNIMDWISPVGPPGFNEIDNPHCKLYSRPSVPINYPKTSLVIGLARTGEDALFATQGHKAFIRKPEELDPSALVRSHLLGY